MLVNENNLDKLQDVAFKRTTINLKEFNMLKEGTKEQFNKRERNLRKINK